MSQEMHNMDIFPTRILLAIDASEEADVATHKAVALADSTGSELHVVYVGELPDFLMRNDPDRLGVNRGLYEEIERESLEILWKRTWQVKDSGGTVAGGHLRMGGVADEIVNLAKDLEADLIVIGSRGHGGLRRAIERRISDFVVRHAPCPVMIVRAGNAQEHHGFWRRIFSHSGSFG